MSEPWRDVGESNSILVAKTQTEFEEYFDIFMEDVKAFPYVGFNCHWDPTVTLSTKSKVIKKRRQVQEVKYARESNVGEDEHMRYARVTKSMYGHTAAVIMSNIAGVTLVVRVSHMNKFPDRLKQFIEGPTVKVGFGPRKDMYKIWEEIKVQLIAYIDLRNIVLNWKPFIKKYHFRRLGTYSLATYLFEHQVQNNCAAACIDWYQADFNAEQVRAISEQTQLDVDSFAQLMIKMLKLVSEGERSMSIFEAFHAEELKQIDNIISPYKNMGFEMGAFMFSEMPAIRKAFDDSERKNLSPGTWQRARLKFPDAPKSVEQRFGVQPYFGLNMDVIGTMAVKEEGVFVSEDGEYKITLKVTEITDLASSSNSAPSISSLPKLKEHHKQWNRRVESFDAALKKLSQGNQQVSTSKRRSSGEMSADANAISADANAINMESLGDELVAEEDDKWAPFSDVDMKLLLKPVNVVAAPLSVQPVFGRRRISEPTSNGFGGFKTDGQTVAVKEEFNYDLPKFSFPKCPSVPIVEDTVQAFSPRLRRVELNFLDKNGKPIVTASSNSSSRSSTGVRAMNGVLKNGGIDAPKGRGRATFLCTPPPAVTQLQSSIITQTSSVASENGSIGALDSNHAFCIGRGKFFQSFKDCSGKSRSGSLNLPSKVVVGGRGRAGAALFSAM